MPLPCIPCIGPIIGASIAGVATLKYKGSGGGSLIYAIKEQNKKQKEERDKGQLDLQPMVGLKKVVEKELVTREIVLDCKKKSKINIKNVKNLVSLSIVGVNV